MRMEFERHHIKFSMGNTFMIENENKMRRDEWLTIYRQAVHSIDDNQALFLYLLAQGKKGMRRGDSFLTFLHKQAFV